MESVFIQHSGDLIEKLTFMTGFVVQGHKCDSYAFNCGCQWTVKDMLVQNDSCFSPISGWEYNSFQVHLKKKTLASHWNQLLLLQGYCTKVEKDHIRQQNKFNSVLSRRETAGKMMRTESESEL